MNGDKSGYGNILRQRRRELSEVEESELSDEWRKAIRSFKAPAGEHARTPYPRAERLFEIVRDDGHIRLMLSYARENPVPDLNNPAQRHQIEAILGFEGVMTHIMEEAESRWRAGDFEGEAAILEEFASRNPQRDAILDLAAEARRDSLSGASTRTRPKRRQ